MVNITLLILLLIASPLFGAETPKEIKFKTRDLEKVQEELNQKKAERQRLDAEAEALKRELSEGSQKIKNFQTSLGYTKHKVGEIEQQLAKTKNQHDQLAQSISVRQESLKSAYKTYQLARLLTTPDSRQAVFSRQIFNAHADQLSEALGKKEKSLEKLNSLVDTQQVIRQEAKKQEDKLANMLALTEDRERLLNKKKTRQEILDNELKELQKTAEELASLIDVLRTKARDEAESQKEERRIKQVSGASPILSQSLPWPHKGMVATRFGRQQHPKSGTTYISNGIVIASQSPASVIAVADGKVLYAGEFMSYGNMVVVEHAGDWFTVYGQLAEWTVEKGQWVKKGDSIGQARPRTAGGYESYFELRFYGKSTNPIPWMSKSEK
ncbi:MAG: hypothetical protein KCHDKBKB_00388 [Elusimicrobia bacterium]|nr:hypothetical protein [Elusimicrobiota bacterium]